MEFSDLSTLEERIGDKKDVSTVFMGKINGWCRARFIVLDRDEAGRLSHVLHTVECIHEEKIKENHLLYLSQTDLLTNIYNRGHGEKAISDLIDDKQLGMFILFDVDKFKLVNDRYGHHIGDEVLIKVADALTKVVGSGDIAMRLGGDEIAFAVSFFYRNPLDFL
ncbi:MAG: GGDEF domain-containing protein [Eubacteriales bacterium]|nr:GGDEF domain-containing protein [Eubacteriales bacterium]